MAIASLVPTSSLAEAEGAAKAIVGTSSAIVALTLAIVPGAIPPLKFIALKIAVSSPSAKASPSDPEADGALSFAVGNGEGGGERFGKNKVVGADVRAAEGDSKGLVSVNGAGGSGDNDDLCFVGFGNRDRFARFHPVNRQLDNGRVAIEDGDGAHRHRAERAEGRIENVERCGFGFFHPVRPGLR